MAFLANHPGGVKLAVKVQPRATRTRVMGVHGDELKIAVTAPPVDAAANEAVVRFLVELLDIPPAAVRIVRGRASRHKLIHVDGLSAEEVLNRLGPAVLPNR